jgi:hypothetical protein
MTIAALHCVVVMIPNKQLSELINIWKKNALSNYQRLIRSGNKSQNKMAIKKLNSIPNPDIFIEKRKHCNKICIECRNNVMHDLMREQYI